MAWESSCTKHRALRPCRDCQLPYRSTLTRLLRKRPRPQLGGFQTEAEASAYYIADSLARLLSNPRPSLATAHPGTQIGLELDWQAQEKNRLLDLHGVQPQTQEASAIGCHRPFSLASWRSANLIRRYFYGTCILRSYGRRRGRKSRWFCLLALEGCPVCQAIRQAWKPKYLPTAGHQK